MQYMVYKLKKIIIVEYNKGENLPRESEGEE